MSRVLILGAGASTGHGCSGRARPPLCNDIFRAASAEARAEYDYLYSYCADVLGLDPAAGAIDIEALVGAIEISWHLARTDTSSPHSRTFTWVTPELALTCLVATVLIETTRWVSEGTCPLHDALLDSLPDGSAIVSFNYDLLMDASLVRAKRKWHYGLEPTPGSGVCLLKPHGSLNWSPQNQDKGPRGLNVQDPLDTLGGWTLPYTMAPLAHEYGDGLIKHLSLVRALAVELPRHYPNVNALPPSPEAFEHVVKSHTHDGFRSDLIYAGVMASLAQKDPGLIHRWVAATLPYLVLPTPNKSIAALTFGELTHVWRHISEALGQCSEVVAIGFSFRDPHFNDVIRLSAKRRTKPLPITIVGPDPAGIIGIKDRLGHTTVPIIPFIGTLADYVAAQP